MFLEVGETDRPRFLPVYSTILGGGYSSLHFSAPLFSVSVFSISEYGYCLYILAACLSPLCLLSVSPHSLKTHMKVVLNCFDTFRLQLRYPTVLSSRGSDSLTYLKKDK